MRALYLLRHAKAVPQEESGPDRERALEKRGRRAAEAVAHWVAEHRIAPELVLCSPSARTRQTLEIVAPAFPTPANMLFEEGLYLASAAQLLARLRRLEPETQSVMLVGHNPGFHELATYLSEVVSGSLMARLAGFPTGALAQFETELPWSRLERKEARLVAVALPKQLIRGDE
ncbi:MAG TPA: phosphohistidine phosphatase SixA [Stellaceae bacterium]|nr:phosphohistidine phosphatase SixA [Stellaceae bacterium]